MSSLNYGNKLVSMKKITGFVQSSITKDEAFVKSDRS